MIAAVTYADRIVRSARSPELRGYLDRVVAQHQLRGVEEHLMLRGAGSRPSMMSIARSLRRSSPATRYQTDVARSWGSIALTRCPTSGRNINVYESGRRRDG